MSERNLPTLFRRSGLALLLLALGPVMAWGTSQEMIPVLRDVQSSSSPVPVLKAFVQMADYGGGSYIALVQAAELVDGHLRWMPVSHSVELAAGGASLRFYENSRRTSVNGRPHTLSRPTVKNSDGFWVPADFFASDSFYRATRMRFDWPPKPVKQKVEIPLPAPPPVVQTPVASRAVSHKAVKRIVIDPGHGGKDPGAVGPHGVEEKAINLLVAQQLADVLRDQHDYEVLLTRTDDTFIPLADRAKLANHYNADLFISVHCNASLSSQLKGYEVYFLSEDASDPHADAVARLENASLALEGKPLPSPNQVKAVLRSLIKTANINESSTLGSLVDHRMEQRLSEPRLGVKQAAFYVLRGAEMPAILVETAFLTNPAEEKLLQKSSFQSKVVEGIAEGIVAYDQRKSAERPAR